MLSIKKTIAAATLILAGTLAPSTSNADETIQGRLEHVFGEDSFGHTVVDQYYIRAEDRTRLAVRLNDRNLAERIAASGQRVTAHITQPGNDGVSEVEIIESSRQTLPIVTGAKKIAFILFSMPGGTNPVTNADVVKTMQSGWFGTGSQTVASIFQTNSYGAVSVGGYQTFGPISLSLSISGTCNSAFYTALDTAMFNATAALDLSSYDYLIYVLPTQMGSFCGWSGITWGPDAAALSGDVNPVVTSHEIGHLFGMGHSTYDANNDGEIVSADGDREYGDPSCIMGGFGRFYNLAHQERQEWWLEAGGNLVTAPTSGTSTTSLSPYQNTPSSVSFAPQAVQLTVSDGSKYLASFGKNPVPGDPSFDLHAVNNNHVFLTRVYPLNSKTYLISALGEGQSYFDSVQNVTFEFVSLSGSIASVRISHGDIDSDADGQSNSVDMDDDNDNVVDSDDCAPLSATHWRVVDNACIGATVPTTPTTPTSYPTLSLSTSTKVTTTKSSFKILGKVKNGASTRGAAASVKAAGKTAFSALKGVSIVSRTGTAASWSFTLKTPKKGVYQVKIYPCLGTTCSTTAKTIKITRK